MSVVTKLASLFRISLPAHRNSSLAYRRFARQPFFAESHEIVIAVMHHPATAAILSLMFGLGFIGWVVTYWL